MFFEKFLQTISDRLLGDPFAGRAADALAKLDPEKFYVENVRSVLGVSHRRAMTICDTAVRQGFFRRRVEVLCPDGAVAASADTEAKLPAHVRCWFEEDGHLEERELPTAMLRKMTAYQLNDEAATRLLRPTA